MVRPTSVLTLRSRCMLRARPCRELGCTSCTQSTQQGSLLLAVRSNGGKNTVRGGQQCRNWAASQIQTPASPVSMSAAMECAGYLPFLNSTFRCCNALARLRHRICGRSAMCHAHTAGRSQ
jgi:hypothetical protein